MSTITDVSDGPDAPRNVLVIGATGFVGGALSAQLTTTRHVVLGVARTDDAAQLLRARGVTPVVGDVDTRRDAVLTAASDVDAVVYAAQVATARIRSSRPSRRSSARSRAGARRPCSSPAPGYTCSARAVPGPPRSSPGTTRFP